MGPSVTLPDVRGGNRPTCPSLHIRVRIAGASASSSRAPTRAGKSSGSSQAGRGDSGDRDAAHARATGMSAAGGGDGGGSRRGTELQLLQQLSSLAVWMGAASGSIRVYPGSGTTPCAPPAPPQAALPAPGLHPFWPSSSRPEPGAPRRTELPTCKGHVPPPPPTGEPTAPPVSKLPAFRVEPAPLPSAP